MAFLSRGVLAALLLIWTAALGLAADRAIIVLDASGSMWGQIDGRPKVDIARETLRTVLQSVPSDMELGLMAYGHREKGSCVDIELHVRWHGLQHGPQRLASDVDLRPAVYLAPHGA